MHLSGGPAGTRGSLRSLPFTSHVCTCSAASPRGRSCSRTSLRRTTSVCTGRNHCNKTCSVSPCTLTSVRLLPLLRGIHENSTLTLGMLNYLKLAPETTFAYLAACYVNNKCLESPLTSILLHLAEEIDRCNILLLSFKEKYFHMPLASLNLKKNR